jgi:hypothetical protein
MMLPKRPPGSERSSQRIGPFPLNFYFRVRSQIIGNVFELYREAANAASPMDSVDPSYAQKLLCELAAWSQSIGFAPHRDFTVMERIFGELNADDSDAVLQFAKASPSISLARPRPSP